MQYDNSLFAIFLSSYLGKMGDGWFWPTPLDQAVSSIAAKKSWIVLFISECKSG